MSTVTPPTADISPTPQVGDRIRLVASTAPMLRPGDLGTVVAVWGTRTTVSVRWDRAAYADGEVSIAARWGDWWEIIAPSASA